MKTLGEFFKSKREASGLSLRDVDKLTNISHGHIKDIEKGRVNPSFQKVIALLKAFHADMDELLKETGYMPSNIEPAKLKK